MELTVVFLKLAICSAVILAAGTQLSKYGDIISEKTGLSGAVTGIVLLAVATSLPELVTGISAVALVGLPDLAVGNALGANLLNLFNIALLDILHPRVRILSRVRLAHIVSAAMGILLIAVAISSIFVSHRLEVWHIGWVGVYTPLLFILYFLAVRLVYELDTRSLEEHLEQRVLKYEASTLRRSFVGYLMAAAFVVGAGLWLASIGEEIAEATGWGASFVGTLFLALTTTMPEIVVSVAALRLGATDMAIGNMLGSNMFNVGIVLAADDLFLGHGPIMASVTEQHLLTGIVAIIMTSIVIAGLVYRAEKKALVVASWEAAALALVYILGMYGLFMLEPAPI